MMHASKGKNLIRQRCEVLMDKVETHMRVVDSWVYICE